MSPRAIAARLDAMAELYRLGMSLRKAKRLGKAADLPASDAATQRPRDP